MTLKKWIGILAAVLAACEIMAFASQEVDVPGIRPQSKQELVPVDFITPEELKTKIAKNEPLIIVDLRSQTSYERADKIIKGSIFTRIHKVAGRLREIPRDRDVIIYCACPADQAAILGARELLNSGFKRVRVLKGGWNAWLAASGQVQPKARRS